MLWHHKIENLIFPVPKRSYAPRTRLKLASFSLNSSNNEAKLAIFLSMTTLNAKFRLLVNISLERDKLRIKLWS